MALIVKSKPKQHTVEYDGGIFLFDAPTDREAMQMFQAAKAQDMAQIEPLFKKLLTEVREVQDQDGKALTAKDIKGASSLGGMLVLTLASALLVQVFSDKEAEEKN